MTNFCLESRCGVMAPIAKPKIWFCEPTLRLPISVSDPDSFLRTRIRILDFFPNPDPGSGSRQKN